MPIQRVNEMQPADEYECRDLLIAVGDSDQQALKETDVRLETVSDHILTKRRWWLLLLDSWQEVYYTRKASVTSEKLWRERCGKE